MKKVHCIVHCTVKDNVLKRAYNSHILYSCCVQTWQPKINVKLLCRIRWLKMIQLRRPGIGMKHPALHSFFERSLVQHQRFLHQKLYCLMKLNRMRKWYQLIGHPYSCGHVMSPMLCEAKPALGCNLAFPMQNWLFKIDEHCSVSRWRPQKVDKRMVLEYTHGLFIT